jgi:hypothetical protein
MIFCEYEKFMNTKLFLIDGYSIFLVANYRLEAWGECDNSKKKNREI